MVHEELSDEHLIAIVSSRPREKEVEEDTVMPLCPTKIN